MVKKKTIKVKKKSRSNGDGAKPKMTIRQSEKSAKQESAPTGSALARKRDGSQDRPPRIHDQPFGARLIPKKTKSKGRPSALSRRYMMERGGSNVPTLNDVRNADSEQLRSLARENGQKTWDKMSGMGMLESASLPSKQSGIVLGAFVGVTWTYDPSFGRGDGYFEGKVIELDDWILVRNTNATFHAPLQYVSVKVLK